MVLNDWLRTWYLSISFLFDFYRDHMQKRRLLGYMLQRADELSEAAKSVSIKQQI